MLAMVNAGTGRSLVTEQMMEQVLSGNFAFGGALALLDKDARLGLAEATALNVPMWTLEQAASLPSAECPRITRCYENDGIWRNRDLPHGRWQMSAFRRR